MERALHDSEEARLAMQAGRMFAFSGILPPMKSADPRTVPT
jgi:hypothetical protein